MRMLYQRNRNGLDYCSRNGNDPQKNRNIRWHWFCKSRLLLQAKHAATVTQHCNIAKQCHILIDILIKSVTKRKIYRTGTENTTTLT